MTMMTDLCNIDESQYRASPNAIGPAEECWLALGIDKHRINYGDYRNDLQPALKFRVGRKWVDVGRVTKGIDPDCLARQIIEYQQSTWADGGMSQNDNYDSLEVILTLAAEYQKELEAAARQEGIQAAMEMGLIDADKCEQFNQWLDAQEQEPELQPDTCGGGGSKKKKPAKHYANAKRPVPDEALHELRQHPWNEHRLACELLYALGIRAEELLDLRRGDFEKRPGYVWVNRRKGGEQPWLPLLDKLMHPELLGFLTKTLEGLPVEPDTCVFTLHYPALYQWCRRNLKVAPHMFRHGIAERLDEASCNPRQIQSWLGHKSLQTTMGYLNPSIEGIARKLNGTNEK